MNPTFKPKSGSNRGLSATLMAAGLSWAALSPAQGVDLVRAEELVQGRCFVCHGSDGESSTPLFPRLAGQNAAYTARQLADYKSGRRVNGTMQPMVADLSEADFRVLGAWFESRPTHTHPIQNAELAQAGRELYTRGNPGSGVPACASCHGPQGHGTQALPRLAGQHALYTENQLKAFHRRERTNDNAVMQDIARRLSALETRAVAAFISGLD